MSKLTALTVIAVVLLHSSMKEEKLGSVNIFCGTGNDVGLGLLSDSVTDYSGYRNSSHSTRRCQLFAKSSLSPQKIPAHPITFPPNLPTWQNWAGNSKKCMSGTAWGSENWPQLVVPTWTGCGLWLESSRGPMEQSHHPIESMDHRLQNWGDSATEVHLVGRLRLRTGERVWWSRGRYWRCALSRWFSPDHVHTHTCAAHCISLTHIRTHDCIKWEKQVWKRIDCEL